MKILVTGSSKGVGAAIAVQLHLNGHMVYPGSRSDGIDISNQEDRDYIAELLDNIDVLVNNAYDPVGQLELLKIAADRWQGTNKMIVNINSKSIFADHVLPDMEEYIQAKKAQTEFINQRRLQASPQILNVYLGLVDTDMSERFKAKKLETVDVAKLVVELIELKNVVYVQEIMLDVPGQDWSEINYE
jgi:short-subunit dehydrogenase